ncbi:MAG: hypothetical protein AAF732_19390, partial [Pseudomonadota bacterium]
LQSQRGYIATAAGMAGLIATLNKPEQARCVDAWIARHDASDFAPIRRAMQKNGSYHPLGVIIAVLQKACGSFKYKM